MSSEPSLPNFFLCGAPKAGTTSLYHYLSQHPQLFACPIKEPAYFAAIELRAWTSPAMVDSVRRNERATHEFLAGGDICNATEGVALAWETYVALFRGVHDEIAVGEGSTVYSWAPGAPARIHARLPGARLIFVLRDPAERFFSQHLAVAWSQPSISLKDRYAAARARHEPWGPALDAGYYATNLQRFLDCFPREQLHVVLYEKLRASPRDVLRGIFRFLGIREDFEVALDAWRNVPILPRFPRLHAVRHALLGSRSLTALFPAPVRRQLQRAYREPRGSRALAPADRRLLVDHYRDEIERTQRLIDRDLSSWLR